VAVVETGVATRIVGHVPRAISSVCYFFLGKSGSITCKVTGSRQHSVDLPQGGLEIPCELIFSASSKKLLSKVQKLLRQAFEAELLTPSEQKEESPVKQPEKKRRLEDHDEEIEWTQHDGIVLSEHDKVQLCSGKWLSDKHVNFAQSLLKKQFPQVNGLKSTLLLHKTQDKIKEGVQIIHSRGNHWIVASTLGCSGSVVKIFDSLYETMDKDTQSTIRTHLRRFLCQDSRS